MRGGMRGDRLVVATMRKAAAGTLEPGFRRATRGWAARLERAGMAHAYREWPGGHDQYWWQLELPAALTWLLTEAGGPGRPGAGRTRAA